MGPSLGGFVLHTASRTHEIACQGRLAGFGTGDVHLICDAGNRRWERIARTQLDCMKRVAGLGGGDRTSFEVVTTAPVTFVVLLGSVVSAVVFG